MKPLFVPLNANPYDQFADGTKTDELRRYGPRWNENTCPTGRKVTLSRGYGKKNRMSGVIWRFYKQHGSLFGSTYKESIKRIYGTLDIEIAVISITNLEKIENV
ncbi:hypothetical protein SAMN05216302_101172 [Nitrosomonas aestuarii]|uniref:ASCH domain-containing protein n=1 Tax=Nitrosomonas aestuarii TaxID=52441 RepID=A0A1I4B9T1_9PROT|nr:hypothetical protein [Nitrosomonas aestuarii]SFK64676.1 hypothetical protein SAMN05216302_101172 [Nitrosomonas aestuarii]